MKDYEKLMGLLAFVVFALNLPRKALRGQMWGPLQAGGGKQFGGAQKVKNTKARVKQWQDWTSTAMRAHGAPATWALPSVLKVLSPCARVIAWHQDAAIKGTKYPALGAYAHGEYWIYELSAHEINTLTIAPLELLAILGSLIVFGGKLPAPTSDNDYTVLVESDSLTSSWKLHTDKGKSPVMDAIHGMITTRPEFHTLSSALTQGHIYGESNPLADNLSRGDLDLFFYTCKLLGVTPRQLQVPAIFTQLVHQAAVIATGSARVL